MEFKIIFEYFDKSWIATCDELKITLEDGSFDALAIRMKIATQEIADLEMGYRGDIRLIISVADRLEEIKAAS